MRRLSLGLAVAVGLASAAAVQAQTPPGGMPTIKTRLDHFSGTSYVLVVSYLPAEITSITCEKWSVLGVNSYKGQNNFTIPSGPAVGVITVNSSFDGYCKTPGSLVAHTDLGDFPGVLDRGPGNWTDSTKLTFVGGR